MRAREVGGTRPQAKECLEPQELEEAGRTLPKALQRDCDPAHTLTSDFWPQDCKTINFC